MIHFVISALFQWEFPVLSVLMHRTALKLSSTDNYSSSKQEAEKPEVVQEKGGEKTKGTRTIQFLIRNHYHIQVTAMMVTYYWYPFWITKRWELERGSQRHRGSTQGHGGKTHILFPSSVATLQTYFLTESSSSLPRTAIQHTQAWVQARLLGLGERISSRQPKPHYWLGGRRQPQRIKALDKEIKENFIKYCSLGCS